MKPLNKAVVIIPSVGTDFLQEALDSIKTQTVPTDIYLVCDNPMRDSRIQGIVSRGHYDNVYYLKLPYGVGKDGFYGHRVYSSVPALVNNQYILFLDEDNYLEPNHVESMINTIETNNLDWCYSLRRIIDVDGSYVCDDNCESLGKYQGIVKTKFLIGLFRWHLLLNTFMIEKFYIEI